jgi:hypothetical protein
VNLWMKRALGAAALGGGLLALSAGAASAQDVAADVSARLGRSTSAEVRVCADGRVLSRLVGSCRGSGTSASAQAGRRNGTTAIRARVRVPGTARADVSLGTGRGTASGQASATPRSQSASADASADSSPQARADASARLTRLALPLLDLDDLTGEAPAGIGVLETGPIAPGNQVGVNVGDISPSVPVTVCGNAVGVLGDTSASCAPSQPASPTGGSSGTGSTGASAGTGSATGDSMLDSLASGNQVDAGIGSISPSVPVTVCGNSVGVLGDASASCGTGQPAPSTGGSSAGTSSSAQTSGTLAGNQADVSLDDVSATVQVTVSCNSAGLLGDASSSCGPSTNPSPDPGSTGTDAGIDTGIGVDIGVNTGTDTSTGGIIAPPPGTTSPGGTDGEGPSSSTGTSGIPGTLGLTPGSGDADGSATSFAPLRRSVAGSGALPFTGAASDLHALVAFGLLVAGVLVVRATRPAAAREGGDDR